MLEFEKPIVEIEKAIARLERIGKEKHLDYSEKLTKLRKRLEERKKAVFSNLSPWQKVELARCSERPHTMD